MTTALVSGRAPGRPQSVPAYVTPPTRRYGAPGELCRHPGCGAVLSDFNDRDRCHCHAARGRKRPRRVAEAPAAFVSPADPAPARTRTTSEEVKLAAKRRQEQGATRAAIVDHIGQAAGGATVQAVADALGIGGPTAHEHLVALLEDGKLSRRKRGQGYVYSLRDDVAATAKARVSDPAPAVTYQDALAVFDVDPRTPRTVQALADILTVPYVVAARLVGGLEDDQKVKRTGAGYVLAAVHTHDSDHAPADDTGAAPASSPGQPAASPSPAPVPPDHPQGPAAAGDDADWFRPQIGRVELGELAILRALEELESAARRRVLGYAADRWAH